MEIRIKEELKRAQQEGAEEIVVVGKLASQLYAARKIKTLSKVICNIIDTVKSLEWNFRKRVADNFKLENYSKIIVIY